MLNVIKSHKKILSASSALRPTLYFFPIRYFLKLLKILYIYIIEHVKIYYNRHLSSKFPTSLQNKL